jgi:hypothetical protein
MTNVIMHVSSSIFHNSAEKCIFKRVTLRPAQLATMSFFGTYVSLLYYSPLRIETVCGLVPSLS